MQKELDRKGVTTVQITSLRSIAIAVGANRIVTGSGIDHPTGNPSFALDRERALRKRILQKALLALQTEVSAPTVFTV